MNASSSLMVHYFINMSCKDGMPIAELAKKTGISEDEVKTILKDEGLI